MERAERGVAEYLTFFQQHPQYVELLIQERAEFRDRKKPTYFVHRDAHRGPWQDLFRGLIAAGRVRDVPVERICDVLSDLVYGTMFINYFVARRKPVEAQAAEILDMVFHGILSEPSGPNAKRPAAARGGKPPGGTAAGAAGRAWDFMQTGTCMTVHSTVAAVAGPPGMLGGRRPERRGCLGPLRRRAGRGGRSGPRAPAGRAPAGSRAVRSPSLRSPSARCNGRSGPWAVSSVSTRSP